MSKREPSKASKVARVRALLACVERQTSEAHGREIASALMQAQFHKADVYEPRGLSDSGLDVDDFLTMLSFRIPSYLSDRVYDYLDRKAAE